MKDICKCECHKYLQQSFYLFIYLQKLKTDRFFTFETEYKKIEDFSFTGVPCIFTIKRTINVYRPTFQAYKETNNG